MPAVTDASGHRDRYVMPHGARGSARRADAAGARSTREMYGKVQAFYGSDDVRETVFLRPDLLHGSTAKLMVEWAKERDERQKRKPKKKKKAAAAAAAKATKEDDSDEDEDSDFDDDDDDVIDIEDSDEEESPMEVAQAAQEAVAAAKRASDAFAEMGLPAPRCAALRWACACVACVADARRAGALAAALAPQRPRPRRRQQRPRRRTRRRRSPRCRWPPMRSMRRTWSTPATATMS